MKRRIGILMALLLCAAAAVGLAACGAGGPPYDSLNREGAGVSVRFEVGDGLFAGATGATVVDVFDPSEYEGGIPLLTPDDTKRGNNAFEVSRPGYFLAGWYTERTETEGGYTYSGRWDFENDRLTVDPDREYDSATPALTLYAAWIPYCTFEFYGESGEKLGSYQTNTLELPVWDERTGKLNMKRFPTVEGKTFVSAYLDAERTQAAPSVITTDYDLETVSPTSAKTVRLYTEWKDGTWFRISTPEQFLSNARTDGCYELLADLDFEGKVWPPLLAKNIFAGKILGNGHKILNVSVAQADNKQFRGGLFGALGAGAELKNVTFENAAYTITNGSITQDACFGLLAGTIAADTVIDGVSVSGRLYISRNVAPNATYQIALAVGTGDARIDFSAITCHPAEEGTEPIFTLDTESGKITLSAS